MGIEEEIQWIVTESIRKGVYDTYHRIEKSLPSCKQYMFKDGLKYDDCMLEKANYSLEYALSEV